MGPDLAAVARQGIAEPALELLFWALILSALGWVKPSGLVVGRASAWGTVHLALFWGVTLMAAALTDVIEKGGWLIAAAVVGGFLSVLTEEIAFRSPERVRRAILGLIGRAATPRGADPEGAVAAPSD